VKNDQDELLVILKYGTKANAMREMMRCGMEDFLSGSTMCADKFSNTEKEIIAKWLKEAYECRMNNTPK